MKIISSELYVKDNKVYHEGNKPKPKDIGAAPETHTHNYASATTPGGSAEHAIKATEDSLGQRIDKYIKGLSVSGRTITYTRGDGTTGTITTQDNDTDTKVTNTLNTTAKAYITGTTNSATNTGTQVFDTNVYLDTTAGMLTATTFKGALQGNAATATALTTSAGSSTQPIYFSGGKPVAGLSYFARSTQGDIGWGSANNNSPVTVSAIAYWNGAYQGTASNLTYCKHGAFGTIVTKNASDYAPTSHNHGLLHDNFGVTIENTTTDNGWSMINGSYNGFLLKSLRSSANAPAWLQGDYSAGIAFGGADTKGVMSVAYNRPSVRFAGGNGSKPVWHFTVNGSSGKTYNMDSLAANTANTLATTRTINGTSFNGSANITTANWGTARTLTIGNTGKSVNGSGNVSWSLDEIGARPRIKKVIDLSNTTTYSVDKWYPCLANIPYDGMHDIEVAVQLNSGVKPSWSTHQSGFTCNLHVKAIAGGWGTTSADSIVLNHSYSFASANPCSYSQLNNSSNAVLWLRGGGKYFVFTDWNASWSVKTASTEISSQTVAPATSCPSISLTKSTMIANLSGNATTATTLQTTRTINGTNFNGSANITTSLWGTARNIQIGNATKSVNGGANVSWSLSEIGALSLSGGTLTGLLSTPNNQMGIRLGDDVLIGDGNIANNMVLQGGQDSAAGGITFGSGKDTNIYRGGANLLKTDDTMNAVGGFQWNGQSLDERYFARRGEIGKTTNWNSIVHPGCYKVQQDSWGNAESTHAPCQGYSYGLLMVYRTDVIGEDRLYQVYMPHRPDEPRWYRMCNNGGWQEWKAQDVRDSADRRYYHAGNKPTASEIGAAPTSHNHGNMLTFKSNHGGDWNSASSMSGKTYMGGWHGKLTSGTTGYISLGAEGSPTLDLMIDGDIYVRENSKVYHSGNKPTASEIGAAAFNHTHGLVNLNSEAFSGGNDLNTYNSNKTWIARTYNTTTNRPGDWYTVANFGADGNSNFQLAHSYANNSILYVRGRHDTSGNYTPWAKIYTDKNKPTASEIGAAPSSSTSLNTTDKTIVGAINEVFQSGNSVKQNLVDTLIAKGAEDISTSNSWDSLIDMIEGSNINLAPISFNVEPLPNAQYGFSLLGSGYYESENFGMHNSYAMCKLNIVCNSNYNVYLDCINYAENNYDYGIISQINTPLSFSYQTDPAGVLKSFKGQSSTEVQTVQLESKSGFYYIKYIKDSTASQGNDSLRFKVRFEKKTGGNPGVPGNPGEETILFGSAIGGDNRNLTGGYTHKRDSSDSYFIYDNSCMDFMAYSNSRGGNTLETVISENRIELTNYSRLRIKGYFTTTTNDSGGAPLVGFDAIGNRDGAFAASTAITSSGQRYYDLDISGLTGSYHLKFNVATSLVKPSTGEIIKHLYITELILYP